MTVSDEPGLAQWVRRPHRAGLHGASIVRRAPAGCTDRQSDSPMDFKTASAHGQTFRFCDSGDGPPVVLIHGFPDTPMGWEDTRLALNAAGFRTLVPYLRGYHPETIVADR